MFQLRSKGIITHNILAIYHIVDALDENNVTKFSNASNVKFGSWDQEAIVEQGNLRMY